MPFGLSTGMDKKSPRAPLPRPSRRGAMAWSLVVAGLIGVPALSYWMATREVVLELRYGQFKQRLVRGEVLTVKVGPTELTGTVKPAGAEGRPVRFHTSRLGMEHDAG